MKAIILILVSILVSTALCLGVAFLGTLLWWLYYPFYTAEAYVRVGPPQLTIMQAENVMPPREVVERNKRTWVAVATHHDVLRHATEDPRVTSKTWYEKNRNDPIKALAEDINVSPLWDTDFIKLSMTGTRQDELADIVNAAADAFIWYAGEYTRRNRDDQIRKLSGGRTDLQNKLTSIRTEIARIRGQSPMAAMERRSTVAIRQQLLTEKFVQAELEQAQADAAMKEYEEERDGGALANNVQVLQAVDNDPFIRLLHGRLVELQTMVRPAVVGGAPSEGPKAAPTGVPHSTTQAASAPSEVPKAAARSLEEQLRELERYIPGDPDSAPPKTTGKISQIPPDKVQAEIGPAAPIAPVPSAPKELSGRTVESAVEWLQDAMEERRAAVIAAQVESIGQLRQMAQAITTERLADLRRRLNDLRREAQDVEESMGRMDALSEEAKAVEDQLRWVERRITEVQMVGRRGGPGEEFVEFGPVTPGLPATTPREIAYPKWSVMMVTGLLLGLVVGLVVGLIRALLAWRRGRAAVQ